MTLHIIKLCVGAESVEDLAEWQIGQLKRARKAKARSIHPQQKAHPVCGTRTWPKGVVSVRQKIVAIDDVIDDHGQRCGLYLDTHLQRTTPQPRRAFQGWRYLEVNDAPGDLSAARGGADLPEHL